MDSNKSVLLNDVLEALEDVGYAPMPGQSQLNDALQSTENRQLFVDIVSWLTHELQQLLQLDEVVNKIDEASGADGGFVLEVNSFLKEINCPYEALFTGPTVNRLATSERRLQLLDFLTSELQAARMIAVNNPRNSEPPAKKTATQLPTESSTASTLKAILIALGLPKPPENIQTKQLFTRVTDRIKEQLSQVPHGYLGQPLFVGSLNDTQWYDLERINNEMNDEYRIRAEALLKRLDVTIQSFTWSDRVKKREQELLQTFKPLRQALNSTAEVTTADLLIARDDLSLVEKTCGTSVCRRTQSHLNKLLMGRVPDRGGRTSEIEPPPPEMPAWKQRDPGSGRGGRGGGAYFQPQQQRSFVGGRGGGGGRVQGAGWTPDQRDCEGRGGGGRYQDQRRSDYRGQDGYGYQQQHGYAGFDQYEQRNYNDRGRGGGYRGRGGGRY